MWKTIDYNPMQSQNNQLEVKCLSTGRSYTDSNTFTRWQHMADRPASVYSPTSYTRGHRARSNSYRAVSDTAIFRPNNRPKTEKISIFAIVHVVVFTLTARAAGRV